MRRSNEVPKWLEKGATARRVEEARQAYKDAGDELWAGPERASEPATPERDAEAGRAGVGGRPKRAAAADCRRVIAAVAGIKHALDADQEGQPPAKRLAGKGRRRSSSGSSQGPAAESRADGQAATSSATGNKRKGPERKSVG